MLKLTEEKYFQKVLEFLSEEMKNNFEGSLEKSHKIVEKIVREKVSSFSEVKKMEEEGEFDYYFSEPVFEINKIIFKEDSLENAKKYLSEILLKVSEVSGQD
jgi:hypothetical protein